MRVKNVSSIETKAIAIYEAVERTCLATHEIEVASKLAETLGMFAHNNAIGRYQNLDIEAHLISIAKRAWGTAEQPPSPTREAPRSTPPVVLHVMTTAYLLGGHTRVVEQLCKAGRDDATNRVVLTGQDGRPHPEGLTAAADALIVLPEGSYEQRARGLAACMSEADFVLLHTHPHDVLPLLASAVPGVRRPATGFYNHADHTFSYGYSVCRTIFEISGFGYEISRANKTDDRPRIFLGIPLDFEDQREVASPREGDIVSAGSPYKYHPTGDIDFIRFAEALVERVGRRFVVIGPDRTQDPAWQRAYENTNGLLDAIGWLPREEFLSRVKEAACYVDSAPRTGGTAFSEVLVKGVPVFALQGPGSGYSVLDAIRQPSDEALVNLIDNVLKETPEGVAYLTSLRQYQGQLADHQSASSVFQRFLRAMRNPESVAQGVPFPYHEQDLAYLEEDWRSQRALWLPHRALRELGLARSLALFRIFVSNLGYRPDAFGRLLSNCFKRAPRRSN